jgi:hypothetical protein
MHPPRTASPSAQLMLHLTRLAAPPPADADLLARFDDSPFAGGSQ